MRKNIDLSDEVVEALTIQAVKRKSVFKLHVEMLLEIAAGLGLKPKKKGATK